jgi:hypothetical protein
MDSLEMGALAKAPTKAPAMRTETTLAEMLFTLLVFFVPSGFRRPKCDWKKELLTTPPAIPLPFQVREA